MTNDSDKVVGKLKGVNFVVLYIAVMATAAVVLTILQPGGPL